MNPTLNVVLLLKLLHMLAPRKTNTSRVTIELLTHVMAIMYMHDSSDHRQRTTNILRITHGHTR